MHVLILTPRRPGRQPLQRHDLSVMRVKTRSIHRNLTQIKQAAHAQRDIATPCPVSLSVSDIFPVDGGQRSAADPAVAAWAIAAPFCFSIYFN